MSYATMDHADWMQKQIDATRANAQRRGKIPMGLPEQLSDFQKKAVDIVGMVGGGIYNAPIADKIDWHYGHTGVAFIWKREMSTWDFDQLTILVFLCHEARIRCQIESAGPSMMRLAFWPRTHKGDVARRHPSLDEAVTAFRAYLPADHRIIYKPVDEVAV
jgi:hypothetical protein